MLGLASGLLVGVFATSAWLKLVSPQQTNLALYGLGIRASWKRITILTRVLAISEGFTALLIVTGVLAGWTLPGLILATTMMVVFTGALVRLLLTAPGTPCGCFGSDKPIGVTTVIRAASLAIIGFTAIYAAFQSPTLDSTYRWTFAIAAITVFSFMNLRQASRLRPVAGLTSVRTELTNTK